jgi:hypothetical protein
MRRGGRVTVPVPGQRTPLVLWPGGEVTRGRAGELRPDADVPGVLGAVVRVDPLTGRVVGLAGEFAVRVAAALAAGPIGGAPGDASRSLPRGGRPGAEPLPSLAPETVNFIAVRRGTAPRPGCHVRRCPRRAELGGACLRCTQWFLSGGVVPLVPADGADPNLSRPFKRAVSALCYAWWPRLARHLFDGVAADTARRWAAATRVGPMAMAAWHLARARPHGGAPGPARAGAYRVGDLAAVVYTYSDRAALWPPAVVAEDWIAALAAAGAGGLERLSELALYGLTSVGEDDPALPFSGDPAGFVADPLRAAGLLATGDGERADATLVLDAALLGAFQLVARCDAVVSYAPPPEDETSVVVAAEPPLDFAGDSSADLHVAASNFLTAAVLAELARAPCRRIVFHGAPPGAVPPGLRHLPTGLALSTLVWEVLCGMAASREFPACVHDDDSAPAPTAAGLAKMVCGAKRIGRCPLGLGGDDDEACCAECAGSQVNYVDAFTARAASGRDLPACATAGWDGGVLSSAARARDTWLRLAAPPPA